MDETAVLIGRFQVPEMNDEYRHQIEVILKRHGGLVLVVAEPGIPVSKQNPLPVRSRISMIAEAYPGLKVLSIKDHPLDTVWSGKLDELLSGEIGDRSFLIYGTKERFQDHYVGRNKTARLEDKKHTSLAAEEEPSSKSFRNGMVHASGLRYASVFPTVDVAVFRSDKTEILLGKKDIDGKWRLIGGFADPDDDGFHASASRELREECGSIESSELTYEGSFPIDDWRYRFEQDKIITSLFSTDYLSGEPEASDDIADLDWFTLAEVSAMVEREETAPEHAQMFRMLLKKYRREQ